MTPVCPRALRSIGASLLPVAIASGCSGGSADSSGASSSAGGASTNPNCSFSGTLSGGVSSTITANGCSTSSGADFSVAQADLGGKRTLGARFKLKTALRGGETGPQELVSFEIFQKDNDEPQSVWTSTSCSMELTKSEHAPTNVFENRFLLTGRGACPSPLEPKAPNTRAAVTVSSFEFRAFINP